MPAVPELTSSRWSRLNANAWIVTTQAEPFAQTTMSPSAQSACASLSTKTYGFTGVARRRYSGSTTG